jgi:large subunit ribosomal protein L23
MALFGSKKKKEEKVAEKAASVKAEKAKKTSTKENKKEKVTKTAKVAKPVTKRMRKTAAKKVVRKSHHASRLKPVRSDLSNVILRPRITEKGAVLATDAQTYVFDVATDATKTEIKAAIKQIYKVTPVKIAVLQVPDKKVRVRGQQRKMGVKTGGKKAYIFLKKGDRIEFV